MSVVQIGPTLLHRPPAERRRFADSFNQHDDALAVNDPNFIHPDVQTEILRRRNEALAHTELLKPVTAEWFERLKHKLADARAAKASVR